jgi:hypothetical protein
MSLPKFFLIFLTLASSDLAAQVRYVEYAVPIEDANLDDYAAPIEDTRPSEPLSDFHLAPRPPRPYERTAVDKFFFDALEWSADKVEANFPTEVGPITLDLFSRRVFDLPLLASGRYSIPWASCLPVGYKPREPPRSPN